MLLLCFCPPSQSQSDVLTHRQIPVNPLCALLWTEPWGTDQPHRLLSRSTQDSRSKSQAGNGDMATSGLTGEDLAWILRWIGICQEERRVGGGGDSRQTELHRAVGIGSPRWYVWEAESP